MFPITALYASVLALMLIVLSVGVIRVRREKQISLTTEDESLFRRVRAHGNFVEYVPMGIILLLLLEGADQSDWMVHALGIVLVCGRILHAYALIGSCGKFRVLGMALTFSMLAFGAIIVMSDSFVQMLAQ